MRPFLVALSAAVAFEVAAGGWNIAALFLAMIGVVVVIAVGVYLVLRLLDSLFPSATCDETHSDELVEAKE